MTKNNSFCKIVEPDCYEITYIILVLLARGTSKRKIINNPPEKCNEIQKVSNSYYKC